MGDTTAHPGSSAVTGGSDGFGVEHTQLSGCRVEPLPRSTRGAVLGPRGSSWGRFPPQLML